MPRTYREFVVQGPQQWTLGFVAGYLCGEKVEGIVLDAEAEEFDVASLREKIADALAPSSATLHLLVPEELVDDFRRALECASTRGHDLKLIEHRKVARARYDFRFTIYSREHAERIRALFEELPEGVALSAESEFKETVIPSAKGHESYAPLHEYELSGRGTVEGGVDGIVQLHRACSAEPLVTQSKIHVIRRARRKSKKS